MDAIFRVEGRRATTSPNAAGPWSPDMQHGSAPSGLVTWAAEAMPTPVPMHIARLTIDLMRPVPLTPLAIETEVLRQGRKIQLCEVRLKADDVLVVRATVLKIRSEVQELPAGIAEAPIDVPGPEQSRVEPADFSSSPFVSGMSLRAARGGFAHPGSSAIWYRVDRPLVEGTPISQVMRAVVASDFSNATSVALDFRHWTFLNADLTISLARQPVGDWILLDGDCNIGPDGAGLAMARLGDQRGYFGRAVQSLVIERR
ncbi:MAG: thioesterase family protein [Rhizobiales bacterium]|nr:thioesterase family protein [Hyphomicrobiales bacterium]